MRRAIIIPVLTLITLVHLRAYAQKDTLPRGSQSHSTLKNGAVAVFAKTASKVVFLITKQSGEPHARASGVILTSDGYIATNYHALKGADAVEIRFFSNPADSDSYQSFNSPKLLYLDSDRDIAILKVNTSVLPFLPKPSYKPRVGEDVYAIGSPRGLNNTISEGIVSALRSTPIEDLIQHTAAISPGSSGGALVDSDGAFLGMNSWQITNGQNLNFAISAKDVWGALARARAVTTTLNYPPDSTDQDSTPVEERTWKDSQPAVKALEVVAERIKACPRIIWFETPNDEKKYGMMTRSRVYFGPPINVVWDVSRSESVRSPYSGYIEFAIPRSFWVPDDVREKYSREDPLVYGTWDKPTPNSQERYEFDLGPGGLRFVRALYRDPEKDKSGWEDDPMQPACSATGCGATCWNDAAENRQAAAHGIKP